MLRDRFNASEKRACRLLKQSRATQRYLPIVRDDELPLTQRIIELASMFGRYGYRRITALLRLDGWWVNHKWVERNRGQPCGGEVWVERVTKEFGLEQTFRPRGGQAGAVVASKSLARCRCLKATLLFVNKVVSNLFSEYDAEALRISYCLLF